MLSKKEFKIFFIFFIIYSLFANYVGWNDDSRILTTVSLVDSKTFSITPFYEFTGDRADFEGNYYSDKPPLSSLIGIPAYLVYRIFNPPLSSQQIDINNPHYALLVFLFDLISAFFGALNIILFYRILVFLKCKNTSLFWLIIAYGFGTMAFSQSTIYNGHSISLFFLWCSVYLLFSLSEKRAFIAGIFIGFAFLTDYLALILFPSLLGYLLFSQKIKKRLAAFFSLGFFIIFLFLLIYNSFVFHDSFSHPYKYTDLAVFVDMAYNPLFYEMPLFSTNFLDILKYRFFAEYTYDELIIYDNLTKQIIFSNTSLGSNFRLINSTKDERIYKHDYRTHKGNFTRYEKLEDSIIIFSGKKYAGFIISLNASGDEWVPISYRIYDTNTTINILFQDAFSYLNDSCTFNTPLFDITLLKQNSSICIIPQYSIEHKKINEFKLGISILSIEENEEQTSILRRITVSRKRPDSLFMFNKIIMLMFYPYRGLFFYSPFLLFSLVSVFFIKIKKRQLAVLSFLIFIIFLLNNSLLIFWWAGSTYGPRFLIYTLPFLLILFFYFDKYCIKKKKARRIILFLILSSVLINLIGQQNLSLSQTNVYNMNNRILLNEDYYDGIISMRGIGSPLTEVYLPLFFKHGPSNIVLDKLFGINLGFLNILLFSLSLIFLKKTIEK